MSDIHIPDYQWRKQKRKQRLKNKKRDKRKEKSVGLDRLESFNRDFGERQLDSYRFESYNRNKGI